MLAYDNNNVTVLSDSKNKITTSTNQAFFTPFDVTAATGTPPINVEKYTITDFGENTNAALRNAQIGDIFLYGTAVQNQTRLIVAGIGDNSTVTGKQLGADDVLTLLVVNTDGTPSKYTSYIPFYRASNLNPSGDAVKEYNEKFSSWQLP